MRSPGEVPQQSRGFPLKRDFAAFNRIYAEYFADVDPKPCRTTVQVSALPTPIAVELKCIAAL